MSLKYKLFGNPANLDEVVHMHNSFGKIETNIVVEKECNLRKGVTIFTEYVELPARPNRFIIDTQAHWMSGSRCSDHELVLEQATNHEVIVAAERARDYLAEQGISAQISGSGATG